MIVTDEMENHPPHPKKRENKKRPVFIVPPWMFVEVPIEVEEKHVALQWSTWVMASGGFWRSDARNLHLHPGRLTTGTWEFSPPF